MRKLGIEGLRDGSQVLHTFFILCAAPNPSRPGRIPFFERFPIVRNFEFDKYAPLFKKKKKKNGEREKERNTYE